MNEATKHPIQFLLHNCEPYPDWYPYTARWREAAHQFI